MDGLLPQLPDAAGDALRKAAGALPDGARSLLLAWSFTAMPMQVLVVRGVRGMGLRPWSFTPCISTPMQGYPRPQLLSPHNRHLHRHGSEASRPELQSNAP